MELVDDLGLEVLIVMGHDSGGPFGMRVALNREARVAGIALGYVTLVELPETKLFIQEDAPQDIAQATVERFG